MSEEKSRQREPRLPFQRIVDDITRQIEDAELAPGDQLPSTTRLEETYSVSRVTVLKAMAVLREQGLIETVPRWGNFVKPK
jgi:DNA-binding GntR family transcriptional regulator